jgi:flagellar basal body-associated protein FliL
LYFEEEMQEERQDSGGALRWVLITLFLLWLAVSVAGYYWVQNAILQPVFEQIGEMT